MSERLRNERGGKRVAYGYKISRWERTKADMSGSCRFSRKIERQPQADKFTLAVHMTFTRSMGESCTALERRESRNELITPE